jgi:hypothetical protein
MYIASKDVFRSLCTALNDQCSKLFFQAAFTARIRLTQPILLALNALTTLLLGFYNASLWARYDEQWKCCLRASARLSDLNVLVGAYLADADDRNDVMRFANAYHHLVYMAQGGANEAVALGVCQSRRMLSSAETAILREQSCDSAERVLTWAAQRVKFAADAHPRIAPAARSRVRSRRVL